jgi:hypothetical protein
VTIIQAAVGDNVQEFDAATDLTTVWAFINQHMAKAEVDRAIVLRDDSGACIGELWDSASYFAHWETPAKMRAYFNLVGFDQG